MAKILKKFTKKFSLERPKTVLTPKQIREIKRAKTIPTALGKLGIERGKRTNVIMKEKLIRRLWRTVELIPQKKPWSLQRKLIEGLADHLSGEAIKDSALKHGVRPEHLAVFKNRFFRADNSLHQYLEELMLQASVRAVGIFHDKADEMSPVQAGMVAGIFADKALALRKARSTDYKDTDVPLATLQKAVDVMAKLADVKKAQAKLIDVEVEVKALPERSAE